MPSLVKVAVLAASCSGSLAHVALVQKEVHLSSDVEGTQGKAMSTCSKSTPLNVSSGLGVNTVDLCPQEKCYGQSSCCHPTGACLNFYSNVCALANKCKRGVCGSVSSGFPVAGSSDGATYHDAEGSEDGCLCHKHRFRCQEGVCWGALRCDGEGTCNMTNECYAGDRVASVGDFCVVLEGSAEESETHKGFKFCGKLAASSTTPRHSRHSTTEGPSPDPLATTTTTSCDTVSCSVYNDPHVIGFDKHEDGPASLGGKFFVRSESSTLTASFSFDGHPVYFDVGDAWLIKSDFLSVQGRYVPSAEFKTGGAVVGALALSGPALDGKRLLVQPRNGGVSWNGHAVSFGSFVTSVTHGELTVVNDQRESTGARPFTQVEIHLPMNIYLLINRYDTYLNTKITAPRVGFLTEYHIEGQCGNYNGVGADDELAELELRMQGSFVLPTESLFS